MKSKIDGFTNTERKELQTTYLSRNKGKTINFKNTHSFKDCFFGLLEYIERVSKKDFVANFLDEKGKVIERTFIAPKKVSVSPLLLRGYSCLDYGCSKCCWFHGFVNIFSEQEYGELLEKYPSKADEFTKYEKFTSKIDNEERVFYKYDHRNHICNHIVTDGINGCGIHELNPIHCAFPLMKFNRKGDNVYVVRQTFGRNHMSLKCPVEFEKPNESTYKYTVELLNRVEKMAKSYNIETWIPEILVKVEQLWKTPDIFNTKVKNDEEVVIYDGETFEDFLKGNKSNEE